MFTLDNLPFNNRYSQLDPQLFTLVNPLGLENPELVSANPTAARLIGLDPEELKTQAFVDYFSGNKLLPGSKPLAMVYSGHQFGSYNPQLGDGRGLLLGQLDTPEFGQWDLHLKGAGKTPYSRFGDGRAVLRSSIREYLCSEAMAALGIATTRALCVVNSDTPVRRETKETGAMILRLARSHIRFGHFEYFHYNQHFDMVKQLADHVIEVHFPDLADRGDKYPAFLREVVRRTALLMAQWMTAGFAHGVMNTDNMSIIGDTFDYGPYGFLDDYNPGFICNHSDHSGRYAFNRQPNIGLWNLNALAHALSSLIDEEDLKQALGTYELTLVSCFDELLLAKLGLEQSDNSDSELFGLLLQLLQQEQFDYSLFFRELCYFESTAVNTLRDQFVNRQGFDEWATLYEQRLQRENQSQTKRQDCMLKTNPKYILRNYLAQQAITQATQQRDYSEVEKLLMLVQNPFDEHPGCEDYAQQPPDWGKELEVSCSS